jgi:UDP-N-acetylmuramate--alanine ligase
MFRHVKRIHFIGIGGIGMSGIAEVLCNLGFVVSGSDAKKSKNTDRLETLFNIRIAEGHAAENVGDAQVVVYSSAVKEDNPEVVAAKEKGVPVIPRAEMLAELMVLKPYAVAVSGTHGKTSTTSMIATILGHAGFDPTTVVGGVVDTLGSNARLGSSDWFVTGRMKRPFVPDALPDDRRRYEYRQRAHGIVQGYGRRRAVLHRFC